MYSLSILEESNTKSLDKLNLKEDQMESKTYITENPLALKQDSCDTYWAENIENKNNIFSSNLKLLEVGSLALLTLVSTSILAVDSNRSINKIANIEGKIDKKIRLNRVKFSSSLKENGFNFKSIETIKRIGYKPSFLTTYNNSKNINYVSNLKRIKFNF
tara:strand:+ start:34572 stop:35051 length:480 start_codon:yes stop_codon:yes gene_type:complete